jgi:hypothetical protein
MKAEEISDFIDWMNHNKWVKYIGVDRWHCLDGKYWKGLRPKTTAELLELYNDQVSDVAGDQVYDQVAADINSVAPNIPLSLQRLIDGYRDENSQLKLILKEFENELAKRTALNAPSIDVEGVRKFSHFYNHGDDKGRNCLTICYGNVSEGDFIIVGAADTIEDAEESCKRLNEILSQIGQKAPSGKLTKDEILEKMCEEMPFPLPESLKPYIKEAMDIYSGQQAPETSIDVEGVRKLGEWQVCPICNGTGQLQGNYTTALYVNCDVCKGSKVIQRPIIHESGQQAPEPVEGNYKA